MLQQRGLPSASEFSEFERQFSQNIREVLSLLNSPNEPYSGSLGERFLVPRASTNAHIQDPAGSVDPTSHATTKLLVDEHPRRMFLPSVRLLILSAVWMERVGTRLELLQSKLSYGNRLRTRKDHKLHKQGPSFRSYIKPYLLWRDGALRAASKAAHGDHKIQIVTFDIANFYGTLRPDFLLDPEFISTLAPLSATDVKLTERLVECLTRIGSENEGTGLPIGLPASAVIANAALYSVDGKIDAEAGIVSYGRYVDDFILVRTAGHSGKSPSQLLNEHIPGYIRKYNLKIAESKTREFEVSSEYASVLMNELRSSFAHLSSEWRSLPSNESIGRLSNLVVETRTGRRVRPELRDADTLATQRWTFSALLSRFSRYSANLEPRDWAIRWSRLYKRLAPIVVAAANIPSSLKHLREFIAITLLSNSIELAKDLGTRLRKARSTIEEVHPSLSGYFGEFLERIIDDSFVVGMGSLIAHSHSRALAEAWTALRGAYSNQQLTYNEAKYDRLLLTAFLGDFGLRPAWDAVFTSIVCGDGTIPQWMLGLPSIGHTKHSTSLSEVLSESITADVRNAKQLRNLAGWLTICARPPSASALSLLLGGDFRKWKKVVKRLTGVTPPTPPIDTSEKFESPFPRWGDGRLSRVTIATGNIATKDDWFLRAAQGSPVANDERRNSLHRAFDHMADHGPVDFCVTPELSIPRAFALDLARLVAARGTTSVLGLEYQRLENSRLRNSALLCFADGKGRFWLKQQNKMSPAHGERIELWRQTQLELAHDSPNTPKPLYCHRGVWFSVLICSELLNATHRLSLRGKIDLLCVPEWNRDLGLFSTLSEAASIDVHCYVAQSNNRRYGDSLLRGPFRDEWARVSVRIRGGLGDHFVGGHINIHALRQFQTRGTSPDGPFKPTPDGFEMEESRQRLGELKVRSE